MVKITFLKDGNSYSGSFDKFSNGLISLKGVPALTGGFKIYSLDGEEYGDYSNYTTIYRVLEDNTVLFSNDGSVFIEPKIKVLGRIFWEDADNADKIRPVSIKIQSSDNKIKITNEVNNWEYDFGEYTKNNIPTLSIIDTINGYKYSFREEDLSFILTHKSLVSAKKEKIKALNNIQQGIIEDGVTIVKDKDHEEKFSLTIQDQSSLEGLAILVEQGIERIPWHSANKDEPCKYYTNEEIKNLIAQATSFITYHVTYFRDLRRYVNSLETVEAVDAVTYGMDIPEEFQSEVLKDIYKQMKPSSQEE